MDTAKLQADLRRFAEERDWQRFHSIGELCRALMVEAAELNGLVLWGAQWQPIPSEAMWEELADVQIYLLMLADWLEIDLETAVRDKIRLNAVKYPAQERLFDNPTERPRSQRSKKGPSL